MAAQRLALCRKRLLMPALEQGFPGLSSHQGHLQGLLKHRWLAIPPSLLRV